MTATARRSFESETLPHMGCLYSVALRLARNSADAADLVQETYLRAYSAWESFAAGTNCRAWLLRILTNQFISGCRRRKSHRLLTDRGEGEQSALLYGDRALRAESPEEALAGAGLGDELVGALNELTKDARVAVILSDLEGLSYREIAEILGCPVGTVMSRLFRAREKLRARLGGFAADEYGIVAEAA